MEKLKDIQKYCRRVASEFHPERIILFGSHAYGKPRRDSDVDLLIVMRFQGKGVEKAIEIGNRIVPSFPLDLIVRTPGQLRRRLAQNDFFLREAVEKGTVLYEASDS